jgi:hypothetical protein
VYISPILLHHTAINNDYLQNTLPYRSLDQHSKSDCLPDSLIYYNFQQKAATLVNKVEMISNRKKATLLKLFSKLEDLSSNINTFPNKNIKKSFPIEKL